jgi:preprotein translocase subunit SecD
LIGIIASLFTAIFVTRTIVDYLIVRRKVKSIPI